MTAFNVSVLEQKFHAIEQFIAEIVKYDTFTDKMYETLKEKVGLFDEYLAMATISDASSTQFRKLKNQSYLIYSVVDHAHHNQSVGNQLVAVGDNFKDDNSFPLSIAIKSELLAILNDKT